MLGGTLAFFMTACIAGLLFSVDETDVEAKEKTAAAEEPAGE